MPLKELEVETIHHVTPPWFDPADTIAITDADGRAIVIRRIQIKELIKKLKKELQ